MPRGEGPGFLAVTRGALLVVQVQPRGARALFAILPEQCLELLEQVGLRAEVTDRSSGGALPLISSRSYL